MIQRNAEDIASGNWESILLAARLDKSYLRYEEGPCPICGGKARFRWRAKKESGFCNGCRFVGPFTILQTLLGTDFRGAADYVRRWACMDQGVGAPARVVRLAPRPRPVEVDDTEQLRQKYRKLWGESVVIEEGMPAHEYLTRRIPGLTAIPKVLRAHASLAYWRKDDAGKHQKLGSFPAMIAAVQGIDGRVANIWRTYLDDTGNKATLPDAKKASGRFLQASYAVRLQAPTGDELAVAEGIETALAVWVMFGIPCWAVMSADGMRKFEVPPEFDGVSKLRIFGDNDSRDQYGRRAGNDAANFLKEKTRAQGRIATVMMPKFTTFDFADIAVKIAA